MSDDHTLDAAGFLVDEEPYCVWEWDLKQRNLDFISNLDPTYFRFTAETFATHLDGESKLKAALSLRTAYSHALEAFMALVGATIQAPDCIPGWLLKYHQKDLESIAAKLNKGRNLASKLKIDPLNWTSFSETISSCVSFESDEKRQWVITGFANAWTRFANEFLDKNIYVEYNNIKHGFRVNAGGFTLAVGQQKTSGIAPSPEEMKSLGGSKFGTSFLVPEKLGTSKNHFRLRSFSRNWAPENFLFKLHLIELSMSNIISFLKITHGSNPITQKFSWPMDSDGFTRPWAKQPGVIDFNMNLIIGTEDVEFFSDDAIKSLYQTKL